MTIFLIALLAAILTLCIMAARRPKIFSVTREMTMQAPAETIFPQVNNLHRWEAWSPWARLDPNATNRFDGPDEGVNAGMAWAGNMKVGVGKMTITESTPSSHIALRLDFEKPMKGTSEVTFTFTPQGSGTRVIWDMQGKSGYRARLMSIFMDCEKMVSNQYDQGLSNLKAIVESAKK